MASPWGTLFFCERMAPRLHHLALLVRDLAAAERFYCGVLGLAVERRGHSDDGRLRSLWLSLAGGAVLMLEKTDAEPHAARPAPGWHVLALAIAPAERPVWRARLATASVPITGETPHTLYFADPEGNRLALSHWPAPA